MPSSLHRFLARESKKEKCSDGALVRFLRAALCSAFGGSGTCRAASRLYILPFLSSHSCGCASAGPLSASPSSQLASFESDVAPPSTTSPALHHIDLTGGGNGAHANMCDSGGVTTLGTVQQDRGRKRSSSGLQHMRRHARLVAPRSVAEALRVSAVDKSEASATRCAHHGPARRYSPHRVCVTATTDRLYDEQMIWLTLASAL
jgi:hypothetical protein